MLDKLPPYADNYFQGIPAPAGALVALLPMTLSFNQIIIPNIIVPIWVLMIGLLMVSTIPMFSFKKAKIERKYIPLIMLVIGGIMAGLSGLPWLTLSVVLFSYLMTIAISIPTYNKLKKSFKK